MAKADVKTANPVFGFSLPKEDKDALIAVCREKYDMDASAYMRIVTRAIIDGRLTIAPEDNKEGIYK